MSHPLLLPRWATWHLCGAGLVALLVGHGLALRISPRADAHARDLSAPAANASPSIPPPAISTPTGWEALWRQETRQPLSAAQGRRLSALLEELARTDPKRALELAATERNWELRAKLRDAALRGWGATAPDAAADWAMSQPLLGERMRCVEAVLAGAAELPNDAVRVGLRLCAADAVTAGAYGHALINALVGKQGAFEAATRFAQSAGMVDGQGILLESVYRQWADHQPRQALQNLSAISDPKIRSAAYEGVISGWASTNPAQLADYAQSLPAGEERTRTFGAALYQWVEKDPVGATEWIGRYDPSPDLDHGVMAVATLPSLISGQPELAMDWAGGITDPALRTVTKKNVFADWARNDRVAARKFAEGLGNPDERESLLEIVDSMEPPP